jgi:anti-sigma factor RsiW
MGPMRRPPWLHSGHLGATVSALVDGQLDADSAERAWQHVAVCPPCHRLVQHETSLKRRLARFADEPRVDEPSDQLIGALRGLDPATVPWTCDIDELEDGNRTLRRAGLALMGAGSVSAAVFGLSALSGPAGTPATSIGGGTTMVPTSVTVGPSGSVHGRLPGYTATRGPGGPLRARPEGRR